MFVIHVHFDQDFVLCVHMYKKVFWDSLLREISILLFQKWYKKVPLNGENAYLAMKNPRASRAIGWALDPGQLMFTSFPCLHCAIGKDGQKFPSGNKVVELFSVNMVVCPCRRKL